MDTIRKIFYSIISAVVAALITIAVSTGTIALIATITILILVVLAIGAITIGTYAFVKLLVSQYYQWYSKLYFS